MKLAADGALVTVCSGWNERKTSHNSGTTKIALIATPPAMYQAESVTAPARRGAHCCGHQSASPCRKRNWTKVISPTTTTSTTDIALARPTLKSAKAVS